MIPHSPNSLTGRAVSAVLLDTCTGHDQHDVLSALLPTIKLALCLPQSMEKGLLDGVAGVDQRHFTPEEAKAAKEVFLTSTSLPVMGVTHWVRLGGIALLRPFVSIARVLSRTVQGQQRCTRPGGHGTCEKRAALAAWRGHRWDRCAAPQDGQSIGDGSVGPVTVKLNAMMERDAMPSLAPDGAEPTRHLPVPYGYVTHMPVEDEDGEE